MTRLPAVFDLADSQLARPLRWLWAVSRWLRSIPLSGSPGPCTVKRTPALVIGGSAMTRIDFGVWQLDRSGPAPAQRRVGTGPKVTPGHTLQR